MGYSEATMTLGEGVAVLVPCYNEAVTIGKVVDDFRRELPLATVYVYDNMSDDGTGEVAAAHGAVVRREPLRGKGNVVRRMLRDIDADAYLMVDGDDTYPAEAAASLLAPIAAGEADHVVGDRLSNGTYAEENDRAFHGLGNDMVRHLVRVLWGFDYADVMTGYRAFSGAFARTLPVLSPGFEIETELSVHAADRGWRTVQVPIDYRDRPEGSVSKLDTVSDGIRVLRTIARLLRDYRPLPLMAAASAVLLALCMLLGIPAFRGVLGGDPAPWVPAALASLVLGMASASSLAAGLVLDSQARAARRQWELQAMAESARSRRPRAAEAPTGERR